MTYSTTGEIGIHTQVLTLLPFELWDPADSNKAKPIETLVFNLVDPSYDIT